MNSLTLARHVLEQIAALGVREVVVCAGARNAAFVRGLASARGVRTYGFFEERNAGFFALGRMQAGAGPVAVVTTSGTAVAELLAPVIEANYQGLPLVVISADRPRAYRGSGAPQAIWQPGLFGRYVEREWDLESADVELSFSGHRPIHVNVCLEEPAGGEAAPKTWDWPPAKTASATPPPDGASDSTELSAPLGIKNPLVLLSGLSPAEAERVHPIISKWSAPIYAEATSQLRGRLGNELVRPGDAAYDSVVRIGGVPTARLWRDLETSDAPVHHFSSLPFRGLSRAGRVWPLEKLAHVSLVGGAGPNAAGSQTSIRERLDELLENFPRSELGLVRRLSAQMPSEARVFLGNSLPIREWDLAAVLSFRGRCLANRGTNGIDGLISTALGAADPAGSNWAIVGDLSALYDLAGPWALRERQINEFNLVIINNGGGKIFSRIFNDPRFENRHELRFEHWAAMWGLRYEKFDCTAPLRAGGGARVIEVTPVESETEAFWKAWGKV